MQIHELNTRTTQATDWLALDTNSQTYKAKTGQLCPEFTSHDASNPTNWDDVAVISSNSNITTFFERLSYAVKNLRYIWKLIGSSSFSNVASTISGAIGNTALTTTATSLSGAIAEHESDISGISSNISTINGNLSDKIKYVDATVTTGTTLYTGYYYADITIPTNLGTFICAMPMFTTSNKPVFLVRYSTTQIRAYSPVASTEVNIRSVFFN